MGSLIAGCLVFNLSVGSEGGVKTNTWFRCVFRVQGWVMMCNISISPWHQHLGHFDIPEVAAVGLQPSSHLQRLGINDHILLPLRTEQRPIKSIDSGVAERQQTQLLEREQEWLTQTVPMVVLFFFCQDQWCLFPPIFFPNWRWVKFGRHPDTDNSGKWT